MSQSENTEIENVRGWLKYHLHIRNFKVLKVRLTLFCVLITSQQSLALPTIFCPNDFALTP